MTHPWKVQARVPGGKFDWITVVDRLPRDKAETVGNYYAIQRNDFEVRLLNEDTAEIVHIEKASAA